LALIRRDPTVISIALMGAGCGLVGAAALLYYSGYFSPRLIAGRLGAGGDHRHLYRQLCL
jgi:hypothetical protein